MSHSRRLLARTSVAVLLTAAIFAMARPALAGIDVPLYRPYLGIRMADLPGGGVTIVDVAANSPAAGADLKAGDRIVSVESRAVGNIAMASEIIASYPPYDTIELLIERQGAKLTRKVELLGWLRLVDAPAGKIFPVPGIDVVVDAAAPNAVEALDRMNVVKRVLIDAGKGTVEFIGVYDPRYATGPLPYRQFLEDAVRHPEPVFSMGEPSAETLKESDRLFALKEADIERLFAAGAESSNLYFWLRRWTDLLFGHPLLANERQLFIRRYAAAAGLAEGEFVLLANYLNFGLVKPSVPEDVLAVQMKLLRNLGFEKQAPLYALYRRGTVEDLFDAARGLGKEPEARRVMASLEAAGKPEGERTTDLRAYLSCELLYALRQVVRSSADDLWRQYERGETDFSRLDATLQRRIVPETATTGRSMLHEAFNGMPLSNELLRLFYGVKPPRVPLVFKNVPPESYLGRALYEADYVLKTIDASHGLLDKVPGHRTSREFRSRDIGANAVLRYTLSPREVPLFVSDDKSEVVFGDPRIEVDFSVSQLAGKPALSAEDAAAAEADGTAYVLQLNDRYEEYAREYPPFHALRETAKILALAKWMNGEKTALRGSVPAGPAWTPPGEVPGLYEVRMVFTTAPTADGKGAGQFHIPISVSGGVDFARKKNWVVMGPKPPSYTPVADQLTTSAALGGQAVQAAQGGNMEYARELAELSARALTGDLDPSSLPKNVSLPKGSSGKPATPDQVRLVKDAVKAIRAAAAGPSGGPSADSSGASTEALSRAGQALRAASSDPVTASTFLAQLQTGALGPKTPAGGPIARPEDAQGSGAPPPFDCAAYMARFSDGADLGESRRVFLEGRIREIQGRLEAARKAMDELGRLRQGDLQAMAKWEGEITAAYGAAQERALDAAAMLLIDGPLEVLQKRRDAMKDAIDYGLSETLLLKNAALDAGDAAKLDRAAFSLVRMKYMFENIYGRTERLQRTLAGAKALYDMDAWANSDKDDFEKIKSGTAQLVEMILNEPAVGKAIRLGKITGDSILRFLSLYKATDAAFGFFVDIMAQKLAWGPVMDSLERSIEANLKAVRTLQERSRDLQNQLNCVRNSLR